MDFSKAMGRYTATDGKHHTIAAGATPEEVDELMDELNRIAELEDAALARHTRITDDTLGVPVGFVLFELDVAVPVPSFISGIDAEIWLQAGAYATRQYNAAGITADTVLDGDNFEVFEYPGDGDAAPRQVIYDVIQSFDIPEKDRLTVEMKLDTEDGAQQAQQSLLFNIKMQLVPTLITPRGAFDVGDLARCLAILEADDREALTERIAELDRGVISRRYHSFKTIPAGDNLPKQDTAVLRMQRTPITKLAHSIAKPELFEDGGVSLVVAGTREKKDVTTQVSFTYDEDDVSLSRPMEPYDNDIQGGLATLWEAGVRVFTVPQLAKAMGYGDKCSKGTLKELERKLDDQRRIMAKIDYTQEARGRNLTLDGDPVESYKLEGHLTETRKTEIRTANGRVSTGYVFLVQPILLQHAKALGQVATYPQRLLKSGKGSDTKANMTIKRAVLERVAILKDQAKKPKKSKISNRMKYATLYDMAGVNPKDRDRRNRVNDFVLSVLADLEAQGAIKRYTEYTEGARRTRAGVEIYV